MYKLSAENGSPGCHLTWQGTPAQLRFPGCVALCTRQPPCLAGLPSSATLPWLCCTVHQAATSPHRAPQLSCPTLAVLHCAPLLRRAALCGYCFLLLPTSE